jgi:hypothetical protein
MERENAEFSKDNCELNEQLEMALQEKDELAAMLAVAGGPPEESDEFKQLEKKAAEAAAELEKARQDAAKSKEESEKALADAVEKVREEIRIAESEQAAEALEALKERLTEAETRAARAEAEKALSASEEKLSFKMKVSAIQASFKDAKSIADGMADKESAAKMNAALRTVLEQLLGMV